VCRAELKAIAILKSMASQCATGDGKGWGGSHGPVETLPIKRLNFKRPGVSAKDENANVRAVWRWPLADLIQKAQVSERTFKRTKGEKTKQNKKHFVRDELYGKKKRNSAPYKSDTI